MNKTAIKNFAIWARNKLIADISYRAGLMGITADGIQNALPQSTGMTEFYDIGTSEPYAISGDAVRQRRHLVELICAKEKESNYKTAYKYVLEEVAYTWFNRLIAVRFMEVNDYLPSHIRVLSSDSGKMEPDLVTTPFDAELSFSHNEEQLVYRLKQENKIDELFRILFIKQCNELNKILPALFEKTSDYTELLLNLSIIDRDGVIYHLVHDIPEEDFDVKRGGQVEIIGWLYQYYNTEPKNQAFAKKGKITKEEVPAVTQLFTPDWIVRYMVENSVGRLWIEHLRALDESAEEADLAAAFGWKYYLPEAQQEPEVEANLRKMRKERASLTPEQITMIDPCMGSGHILVYAFDVLMQVYENAGYGQRDAAKSILVNNLFGLDIDDRAYQMAYFSVMMKAREYNRRILNGEYNCKVYSIQESNGITDAALGDLGANLSEEDRKKALKEIKALIAEFKDAKEYGSILNVEKRDWDLLRRFAVPNVGYGQLTFDINGSESAAERLQDIINIAVVMSNRYFATVTNPPYMVISNSSAKLNEYVKKHYIDSKADLFAVFIERCSSMTRPKGVQAMITMHSWMFITSFETLRKKIINKDIVSMLHLGAHAFDEIGGEVVQTTSFIIRSRSGNSYKGSYFRLVNINSSFGKEQEFLTRKNIFISRQDRYSRIPSSPIAYWISNKVLSAYDNDCLSKYVDCKSGIMTGSDSYIRLWFEPSIQNIKFDCQSYKDMGNYRWFPLNSGGEYRKWYGNNSKIVNLWHQGYDIIHNVKNYRLRDPMYYFKKGITWGRITTSQIAFREVIDGSLFGDAGPVGFVEKHRRYILGFLGSKVVSNLLQITNPTMNFQVHDIMDLPLIIDIESEGWIEQLVERNIEISKEDWDSFETSWDFKQHPLCFGKSVQASFDSWENNCNSRIKELLQNEEAINRFFIEKYGLEQDIEAKVNMSEITIKKANLKREIASLLSYAVGCMFGRYSLDTNGLTYAGADWDASKYSTFIPNTDNVIPITDEEYLEEDIVCRLCKWLKVVYGESNLEENLYFISKALGNKGSTSREIIRNYFINDFFKDHCQTYSVTGSGKRPIYWLFDSGKENGFKALIYLHRYNVDTIGNLRIDYLHRMQRTYESEISRMQDMVDHSTNAREVAQAVKRREKLTKQLKECRDYDEKLAHLALSRIELDLDDGVKKNYRKIQTANDGKFYEVLADSKNIMSKE